MRIAIIILLMMVTVQVVTAEPIDRLCTDTIEIKTNCTMVTPAALTCATFLYNVTNVTNQEYAVTDGELSPLNDGMYYFNFTLPTGHYIIKLCDQSTREVRVTDEDTDQMVIGATIFLPIILGIFFLVGAVSLGREHSALKIFLYLLGIVAFWGSLHISLMAVDKFYEFQELEETLATVTFWSGLILFVLISYFSIYALKLLFDFLAKRRRERIEGKIEY